MKVKNVWKATWFSFAAGFILVSAISLGFLFFTNDVNCCEDIYITVSVLMVLGVVYAIIQFSFSFLVDDFLVDQNLSPKQVLVLTLQILLFLYCVVFFICWGISGFSLKKDVFEFILGCSIPYILNCIIFVFRLHYLCWRDLKRVQEEITF